ncbi:MAG TPA: hypothetical protein DD979_06310 [Gammaproteobacteria bacterium]|jgi:prepilin-type N-terminal cleavage/methylation domain-containing protein|nr:hypothetical protein [Gammaproteobacteria bacterium]
MDVQGKATRATGFTLVEMVGVMAIMAILASAIVPNMIRSVMRARADQETTTLSTLADDLQRYILTNQSIPSPATNAWTTALASVSDLPRDKVEYNDNGFRRALYFDPRFLTSSDTTFTGYVQQHGNITLVSPRVMLVSSLQANASAAPTTTSDFDAIWDQTSSASVIESESIKIERLNLGRFFHRLVLVNEGTSNNPAYTLGTAAASTVTTAASPLTLSVLENTQVELFDSAFAGGLSERVFIVKSDTNYRYFLNGSDWDWEQP